MMHSGWFWYTAKNQEKKFDAIFPCMSDECERRRNETDFLNEAVT